MTNFIYLNSLVLRLVSERALFEPVNCSITRIAHFTETVVPTIITVAFYPWMTTGPMWFTPQTCFDISNHVCETRCLYIHRHSLTKTFSENHFTVKPK